MEKFAEFTPITLNNPEIISEYYADYDTDLPKNQYFKEFLSDISGNETNQYKENITPVYKIEEKKVVNTTPVNNTSKEVKVNKIDYINKYWADALAASKISGVPPETLIAMSALETGYGKHMPGNMVAGIKASRDDNTSKKLLTSEFINGEMITTPQNFKQYNTVRESFLDFGKFLLDNTRYKKALSVKDPFKAIHEIAKAGYATDPLYEKKVSTIIKQIIKNKITPS